MSVPSGSSLLSKSFRFVIEDSSQIGVARRHAAVMAEDLEFTETDKGRLAIIVNELCTNLINHAGGGEILLRGFEYRGLPTVEVLSIDKGRGIADIEMCMKDGYSTTSTPGNGLGAVKRQSSFLDIYSQVGKGTVLVSYVHAGPPLKKDPEPVFQCGAICIPIKGETDCGDGWGFYQSEGKVSVMVADGLGHGTLAYRASALALEIFQAQKEKPLEMLMQLLNGALKSTRGAAISVAEIRGNNLTFAGVGNVRGALLERNKLKNLISHAGTVGLQQRPTKSFSAPWEPETLLIMHSDGLLTRWELTPYPGLERHHPSLMCAVLYRDFNRQTDDVTILVGGFV